MIIIRIILLILFLPVVILGFAIGIIRLHIEIGMAKADQFVIWALR